MTRDMTQGNPLRLILNFFVPVLMGNLFQQFYNVVDSIIVGRFVGVEALAALGSTGSLYFLVIGFVTGMCSGFSVPIARHFGAKNMRGVHLCIFNQIFLCLGITAVLTAVVLLCAKPILLWMNTPADIFEDAYRYIFIIFAGLGVTMFYNLLANISRAVGDSRTPLYFLILASIVNIVLDLVFVLAFHMATAGVAIATVLAQAVAGAACLVHMYRKFPELRIEKNERVIDPHVMGHSLLMGFPMALQFSITAVGGIILQTAINPLGSGAVAAVTAGSKVSMMISQPIEAMGPTAATYCSQNLGAGKLERVTEGVRKIMTLALVFSVAVGLLGVFCGPTFSRMFISGDETALLGDVSRFLHINCSFMFLLAILLVLRNALQGLTYAVPAMAAGLLELVARALIGLIFVGPFGFWAVCFASPMAWLFACIFLIPAYVVCMKRLHSRHVVQEQIQLPAGPAAEAEPLLQ